MKPLKYFLFLLPLALLVNPFQASAAANRVASIKSEVGLGAGLFLKSSSEAYSALYKKAEEKRRMARAHRKALLRKVKKSKKF